MFKTINKIKISIGALLLLSAFSVVAIIYKTKQTSPVDTPLAPLTPKIPDYIKQPLSIDMLEVDKNSFNFPLKLPLLKQEGLSPISETRIKSIADNLGFSSDPVFANDAVNGIVNIWNNKDNFLIITPKIRKIKFGPASNPQREIANALNKQLSEKDIVSSAENFLIDKIGLDKSSLVFANIVYLQMQTGLELFKETGKKDSTIFQVNFSYSGSPYPILTLEPQSTVVYVQILKDGSVLNSEINLVNNFSAGLTEHKLKSYEEVAGSLDRAILVSLNDGNINLPDLKKDDLSKISINEIQLAYLLDTPLSEYLQPVFVLKGTASISGSGIPVNADFFLPAFSN
ncbi:MAG: hypothetical protein Q8P91_00960 [bacterium]|nr:hypothetical protein [bacterium]